MHRIELHQIERRVAARSPPATVDGTVAAGLPTVWSATFVIGFVGSMIRLGTII
jgi:hypothetical protein